MKKWPDLSITSILASGILSQTSNLTLAMGSTTSFSAANPGTGTVICLAASLTSSAMAMAYAGRASLAHLLPRNMSSTTKSGRSRKRNDSISTFLATNSADSALS